MPTKSELTLTVTLAPITGADMTPEISSLLAGAITADILYNRQVRGLFKGLREPPLFGRVDVELFVRNDVKIPNFTGQGRNSIKQ